MYGECHEHLFMNGTDYHAAVRQHEHGPDREDIRRKLGAYRDAGITFVREGGDHMRVGEYAREIAGEFGVDLRVPVYGMYPEGQYGRIVGRAWRDMREYRALVQGVADRRGDFIKLMLSGILDFASDGHVTGEAVSAADMTEMVHIAHEEGFAVMAHVNGARAVRDAALAGVDSIEHGNFMDEDALDAVAAAGAVWVPTCVTITNLIGDGRFDDRVLRRLAERQAENVRRARDKGIRIALGSDAGAYRVPHVQGLKDEITCLRAILGEGPETEALLAGAEAEIRRRFRRGGRDA